MAGDFEIFPRDYKWRIITAFCVFIDCAWRRVVSSLNIRQLPDEVSAVASDGCPYLLASLVSGPEAIFYHLRSARLKVLLDFYLRNIHTVDTVS